MNLIQNSLKQQQQRIVYVHRDFFVLVLLRVFFYASDFSYFVDLINNIIEGAASDASLKARFPSADLYLFIFRDTVRHVAGVNVSDVIPDTKVHQHFTFFSLPMAHRLCCEFI